MSKAKKLIEDLEKEIQELKNKIIFLQNKYESSILSKKVRKPSYYIRNHIYIPPILADMQVNFFNKQAQLRTLKWLKKY